MKKCEECNKEKDLSKFYKYGTRKDGTIRYYNKCKDCVLAHNRKMYNENEEYRNNQKINSKKLRDNNPDYRERNKNRGEAFYASVKGRAMNLFKSAQRRADKFEDFDLDLDFILSKVQQGHCEVTGIKFDFDKSSNYNKNPYAPSIDRIDSKIGYIKSNVRIVIWQYNLMKGELLDAELFSLCKLICDKEVVKNES